MSGQCPVFPASESPCGEGFLPIPACESAELSANCKMDDADSVDDPTELAAALMASFRCSCQEFVHQSTNQITQPIKVTTLKVATIPR